jgi:hypothetical protein
MPEPVQCRPRSFFVETLVPWPGGVPRLLHANACDRSWNISKAGTHVDGLCRPKAEIRPANRARDNTRPMTMIIGERNDLCTNIIQQQQHIEASVFDDQL